MSARPSRVPDSTRSDGPAVPTGPGAATPTPSVEPDPPVVDFSELVPMQVPTPGTAPDEVRGDENAPEPGPQP